MRRVIVLLCCAGLAVVPQPGRAGCSGPEVRAQPQVRQAGQPLLVTGRHWVGFCDDQGEMCAGCTGCSERIEEADVDRVVLELRRRSVMVAPLETVEVSETDSFALEVTLPQDLEPGRYRVVARAVPGGEQAAARLRIVR